MLSFFFVCLNLSFYSQTLSYLKKVAPSLGDSISNGYSRCLMSGLLSSRLVDVQPSSLSQVSHPLFNIIQE